MDLKNKVIIVTGASAGIGREICALLAKEKAIVVAVSRTKAKVVDEIIEYGEKAIWMKASVTNEKEMQKVFSKTKKKFKKIDGVINNAGIMLAKPIDKITYEEFDKVLEVNVKGEFIGCKLAKKHMKNGTIINTASDVGLIGKPNLSGYCASKFAVVGMTEALGKEFKKIKIYSVCPRAVATSMSNHKGNSPVLVAKSYIKLLKGETKIKNGGHILVGSEKDSRKVWKNGVPTVKLNAKS